MGRGFIKCADSERLRLKARNVTLVYSRRVDLLFKLRNALANVLA